MYAVAYGPLHWHRSSLNWKQTQWQHSQVFPRRFYIVYADTQEEAYARVERIAKDQEIPKDPDSDESRAVTVRYIVDVAPTLYDNIHEDCDLYSRHFASLADYKRFEMKLGGLDPLTGTTHPEQ